MEDLENHVLRDIAIEIIYSRDRRNLFNVDLCQENPGRGIGPQKIKCSLGDGFI